MQRKVLINTRADCSKIWSPSPKDGRCAISPPSCVSIHWRVATATESRDWPVPFYGTVHSIIRRWIRRWSRWHRTAQDGPAAYRDRFEMIHRHRARAPNAIWQADHTMMEALNVDAIGKTARLWLTTIMDDHPPAMPGNFVFLGASSALQTSPALRQAIWRKQNPDWPVCGIPKVLYVNHGSDFTSEHLDQAAAALRIQLVHFAVAKLQGRRKIEHFFGILNSELLPDLSDNVVNEKPVTLSLPELDTAVGT